MLKLGDRTSLRCVSKRTEASNTAERIVPGARHSTWTRNTGLEGLSDVQRGSICKFA